MPSKLQMYEQMADHTAKQVTGSFGEWTAFLETMGRLYKYPFHEQLMIFAQKPNATACADYDLWNKRMGRYVRRGSTLLLPLRFGIMGVLLAGPVADFSAFMLSVVLVGIELKKQKNDM